MEAGSDVAGVGGVDREERERNRLVFGAFHRGAARASEQIAREGELFSIAHAALRWLHVHHAVLRIQRVNDALDGEGRFQSGEELLCRVERVKAVALPDQHSDHYESADGEASTSCARRENQELHGHVGVAKRAVEKLGSFLRGGPRGEHRSRRPGGLLLGRFGGIGAAGRAGRRHEGIHVGLREVLGHLHVRLHDLLDLAHVLAGVFLAVIPDYFDGFGKEDRVRRQLRVLQLLNRF